MRSLSIALVHYPVLGKSVEGSPEEIVTSAVTNLDVHDLSRSARTYNCDAFYIVHPIEAQRELVRTIQTHWTTGSSSIRIPSRKRALERLAIVTSIEAAVTDIQSRTQSDRVEVWTTAARGSGLPLVSYASARTLLHSEGAPVLLLFGTSWGLTLETLRSADLRLEPIRATSDFNHLSVRAACSITLDRLVGD
ncbi:MAG: RNA methyltransferase [Polyangiaceae bacterium]|nr:RNA methyltransferase [Polyangiaceae bacterium]